MEGRVDIAAFSLLPDSFRLRDLTLGRDAVI